MPGIHSTLKRCYFAIGVLALVVIAIPRFWRLDTPLLTTDESFTSRAIEYPLGEMVARVGEDGHGPGHFLLLKATAALGADSPLGLRLPSLVCGVLCAAGTFFVVRAALPTTPNSVLGAALAGAQVGLGALQVEASRTARMYALGCLLAVLSSWLLLRALREIDRTRWWCVLFGVVAAAFCYTHHFGFFTLAGQALFVVLEAARLARKRPESALNIAYGGLLAAGTALALYAPWLPTFLSQAGQVYEHFWIPPLTWHEVSRVFSSWSTGLEFTSPLLVLPLVGLTLALVIYSSGFRWGAKQIEGELSGIVGQRRAALFFLCQAGAPWAFCLFVSFALGRSIFQERYLVFAQLAWFGLLGLIVARLPTHLERGAVAGTLLVFSTVGLASSGLLQPDSPQPGVAALSYLCEQRRSADLVLVRWPEDVNRTRYYAKRFGDEPLDVRCRRTVETRKGHECHIAALTGNDILWGHEQASEHAERVWLIWDEKRGEPQPPTRMTRVFERRFEGQRDGAFVLALYERASRQGEFHAGID